MTREHVYGRRAVREALRGSNREVLEIWATERAVKASRGCATTKQPRVQVKLERDLSEEAGTRDHQGVLAWCEPYRYADAYELAATDRPLLACLDQVSDPRNLGAVCRSAEGAGATGVVVPSHGSALVTPVVCRSSAGAVEHLPVAVVTNLARYLEEIKSGDLWVAAAAGESGTPMWQTDLSGGLAFVFGAEGKGLRPLVRRTCDLHVSIPQLGQGRVTERQRRSRGAALRGAAPTRWLSRRCICSTASTFSTRAASSRRMPCATCSPGWVATQGRSGRSCLRRPRARRGARPALGALGARRGRADRAPRGRFPERGAGRRRLLRRGRPRNIRGRGAKAVVADVPLRAGPRRSTWTAREATCATSSTRRPSRGSSGCAAGS